MMTCRWVETDDVWATDCGHAFQLIDGTPEDNEMRYCCYCGRPLQTDHDEAES